MKHASTIILWTLILASSPLWGLPLLVGWMLVYVIYRIFRWAGRIELESLNAESTDLHRESRLLRGVGQAKAQALASRATLLATRSAG